MIDFVQANVSINRMAESAEALLASPS